VVAASDGNEPDRHYPETLIIDLDAQIGLVEQYRVALRAGRKLPDELMRDLEKNLMNMADDIVYCLNVKVTKLNYNDTMDAFSVKNAEHGAQSCVEGANSVDEAVMAFVEHHCASCKSRVAELKEVLARLNQQDRDDADGNRPELVRKVFIAAQLGRAVEERTVNLRGDVPLPPKLLKKYNARGVLHGLSFENQQILLAAAEAGINLNTLTRAVARRGVTTTAAAAAAAAPAPAAPVAAAAAATAAAAAAAVVAPPATNSVRLSDVEVVHLHAEGHVSSADFTMDDVAAAHAQENVDAQAAATDSNARLESAASDCLTSVNAIVGTARGDDVESTVSFENVSDSEVLQRANRVADVDTHELLDVVFTHDEAGHTFELYNEEVHVHELQCGEPFSTTTHRGRCWSMRVAGRTLQQWEILVAGTLTLSIAERDMPARRQRRHNAGSVKKWRPADEEGRKQWGDGSAKRHRGD
jgi:hypothetical protein